MENSKSKNHYSSDSDIITETPPKKIAKRNKKRIKNKTYSKTSHHYEDYRMDRKYIPRENHKIEMTRHGSVHYNKPYVYRTIDEILEIESENFLLKNNNIHLVGVYSYNSHFGHHLKNISDNNDKRIVQLDFLFATNVPGDGECISIYGSLEQKAECLKNVILVVRFYRQESIGVVSKYKENLKFVRSVIPNLYLATTSNL